MANTKKRTRKSTSKKLPFTSQPPSPKSRRQYGSLKLRTQMSQLIREEEYEETQYLVIPMIMIREGVHNQVLFESGELEKFPSAWNGRPVVIYHPKNGDTPVGASATPGIFSTRIGYIFNARYDDGALRAEAWIDPVKADEVNPRLMEKIRGEQNVDVSIGAYQEEVYETGEWNGESYMYIATAMRPDHLAVLPDGDGACSWLDGAGLCRVFEASHENIGDQLWRIVREQSGSESVFTYIIETFDRSVIYGVENDEGGLTLYKQGYSVEGEGEVVLLDDKSIVEREVSYVPAASPAVQDKKPTTGGTDNVEKEERTAMVDSLIANKATKFAEADREFLTALEDDQLALMEPVVIEPAKVEPTTLSDGTPLSKGKKAKETETEKIVEVKPATFEELLAAADGDTQDVIREGISTYNSQRNAIVTELVSVEGCPFTAEDLTAMKVPDLKKLQTLAGAGKPTVSYEGRDTEPQVLVLEDDNKAPGMPEMTFG